MILFAAEKAGLHYTGRPLPVFRDLTLTIHKGESLRLTGPSGAGKSSLIRLIAGLEQPTSGCVTTLPGRIGMAFAEPRLLPQLSVLENLLFVAPRTDSEAMAMLDSLEMTDLRDARPDSLSKGQAQRAALIRALLIRPEILLLDEALGGLDLPTWQRTHALILTRRRSDGFALVEISHDPARILLPGAQTVALGADNVTALPT
jgi:sulfonate transport system ATP-binding protein